MLLFFRNIVDGTFVDYFGSLDVTCIFASFALFENDNAFVYNRGLLLCGLMVITETVVNLHN
jgi:hypothetical protein